MLSLEWRQSLFFHPLLGLYFFSALFAIIFAFPRYPELFVFTSNTGMYTPFLYFQLCHQSYVHYVVNFSIYFSFVSIYSEFLEFLLPKFPSATTCFSCSPPDFN
jgi:hypothetical protein